MPLLTNKVRRAVLLTEGRLRCRTGVPDTPGSSGVPGDVAALRAENARLRETVERQRMLLEDKDAKIAGLEAGNAELEERVARLERLISRNSGNSSMPPERR
jgi:hypothetical protein